MPGAAGYYAGFDLRPCLSSLGEIREWAAFCDATGRRLRAAVHIDTGINRLGLPADEVGTLAAEPALFDHFELALVMSHLACADEPAHPMNRAQRTRFDDAARQAAASARQSRQFGRRLARPRVSTTISCGPGIALYGGRRSARRPNPMQWVVRLQARILQVRDSAPASRSATAPRSASSGPRASRRSPAATPTASCAR